MIVKLFNSNECKGFKKYTQEHQITLIPACDKITIVDHKGNPIAELTVQTMWKDNEEPTDSFFLNFKPLQSGEHGTADIFI